jgi:V8-like Glu-specific endopeptidase
MLTADEAASFRAVGRLNIAGRRFCSATLIAEDVVVTAAHCLFHPRTRARVPDSELRFVAGLRLGETAAVRRVSRTAVHPDFTYDGIPDLPGVRSDLAVALLDAPVASDAAAPIPPAALAGAEAPLAIVSYARDRPQAPSIEAPCHALVRFDDVAALDCGATYGASGAPLLEGGGEAMRVVGVVSAVGRILENEADVTLAVLTERGLAPLVEDLRSPDE